MKKNNNELKTRITEEVTRFLLEESKQLFSENPEMTSFGWHQFISEQSRDRYIRFEESLLRPDISGALGEFIYSTNTSYPLQQKVVAFLKKFDGPLLKYVFGDGIDITVYRDGTIEVIGDLEYDINRLVVV